MKQAIRQFAEGDERLLRVLDRPDWEQLAENMPGMEKFIPMLKGQGSVYSLRESTYPRKSHEIELARKERLDQITTIWVGLGIFAGFVVFVLFVRSLGGNLGTVLVVIVIIGMLIGTAVARRAMRQERQAAEPAP